MRLRREYPSGTAPSKSDLSRYGYGTMFIQKEGWSIRIRPLREIFVEGQLGMNLRRTLLGLVGGLGFVLLDQLHPQWRRRNSALLAAGKRPEQERVERQSAHHRHRDAQPPSHSAAHPPLSCPGPQSAMQPG